jgi:general secretion pathway protein H
MKAPDPSVILRPAGFTLLEIMVVLAVMALALALITPDMAGMLRRLELTSTTRELASALRYTRSHAIAVGRPADFWLNVKERKYRAADERKVRRLPDSLRLHLKTADTQTAGGSSGYIRFFPDGSSTGGQVRIESGGAARRLDVNWLTGEVRLSGGGNS